MPPGDRTLISFLQTGTRTSWLAARIGEGGWSCTNVAGFGDRSPGCWTTPPYWLAAPGSNRAHSRLITLIASCQETGAEDEDRTRIMSLEGSGPAIGRPPRRRGMESNHHPAFFKRVREPSLLPRQNWLRDQELHLATPAYEAGSTLGLPALRNLVAAVGYDPTRSRQSAPSYKAHPLARADGRSGAGNRERSGDLLLGKQALSH